MSNQNPSINTTPTYRRTLHLFKKQNGICWICGLIMLPPADRKKPNRFTATLDHLAPRNSGYSIDIPRPVKAAHRGCNSSRHHNNTVPKGQIKAMRSAINGPHRRIIFGDQESHTS